MKKLLLLAASLTLSVGVWADCNNPKTSHEIQKCLNLEVTQLRYELDGVLKSASKSTSAQEELQTAQNKWVLYKESQCGDFVVADAQGSPATVAVDLTCQAELYRERINFLKSYFSQ